MLHKNPALLEADGAAVKGVFAQDRHGLGRPILDLPGDNHLIDEECVRYLRFLFEVRAWKLGLPCTRAWTTPSALSNLSEALLGHQASAAHGNLDWIGRALDVWLTVQSGGFDWPQGHRPLFASLSPAMPRASPQRLCASSTSATLGTPQWV